MAPNLVDLLLQVVHDFCGELVAQNFEKIDLLVAGNAFVSSDFDAFLHLFGFW